MKVAMVPGSHRAWMLLLLGLSTALPIHAAGQVPETAGPLADRPRVSPTRTSTSPEIDGRLDEYDLEVERRWAGTSS